ncbi:MAG: hypothetical protein ACO1SV_12220 [Fimbriimonas sp.]
MPSSYVLTPADPAAIQVLPGSYVALRNTSGVTAAKAVYQSGRGLQVHTLAPLGEAKIAPTDGAVALYVLAGTATVEASIRTFREGTILDAPDPINRDGDFIQASFTRAADATPYSVFDMVCPSGNACFTLPIGRFPGDSFFLPSFGITVSGTGTRQYKARLYSAAPVAAAGSGDNLAYKVQSRGTFLCAFDVTVADTADDGTYGVGAPSVGRIPFIKLAANEINVYGFLSALNAHTPGNAETIAVGASVLYGIR